MEFVLDSVVNKLILLYAIDKMEIPLTENSIVDICTSRNKWLSYMDCRESLWQLIETGFIACSNENVEEKEKQFVITYDGRSCLGHYFQRIPVSLREEISSFAKANRSKIKRNQEYVSDYFKNTNGSYTVVLKIKDSLTNESMFEIKLKISSRNQAVLTCKNWREQAPEVYEYILEHLNQM